MRAGHTGPDTRPSRDGPRHWFQDSDASMEPQTMPNSQPKEFIREAMPLRPFVKKCATPIAPADGGAIDGSGTGAAGTLNISKTPLHESHPNLPFPLI